MLFRTRKEPGFKNLAGSWKLMADEMEIPLYNKREIVSLYYAP